MDFILSYLESLYRLISSSFCLVLNQILCRLQTPFNLHCPSSVHCDANQGFSFVKSKISVSVMFDDETFHFFVRVVLEFTTHTITPLIHQINKKGTSLKVPLILSFTRCLAMLLWKLVVTYSLGFRVSWRV